MGTILCKKCGVPRDYYKLVPTKSCQQHLFAPSADPSECKVALIVKSLNGRQKPAVAIQNNSNIIRCQDCLEPLQDSTHSNCYHRFERFWCL